MSSPHNTIDIQAIRSEFPSLQRKIDGQPITFLDGPAGTQVPEMVINAISDYYRTSNANTHGHFTTTKETDLLMQQTRSAVADYLNAPDGSSISFGQNMTTLNFSLSTALAKLLQPGDEILITELDHESNRQPWLKLQNQGVNIKEIKLLPSGLLDYEDAASKISERTRLVAIGWAANITGTINDVHKMRELSNSVGAFLLIDAVHYAAHFKVDVTTLDCDFLLCSAYKYYGPHVGILYCKPGLLDDLDPDRLRTSYQAAPYRIETGTLNHAAMAGVKAAVEFLAKLGSGTNLREKLDQSFEHISHHEYQMANALYEGLKRIPGINFFGPDFSDTLRAPTISFYHEKFSAQEICKQLATQQIQAWAGHFYAIKSTEVTGLLEKGGLVRMGISLYTDEQDIQRTIDFLKKMIA